jgi:hypothetical protein
MQRLFLIVILYKIYSEYICIQIEIGIVKKVNIQTHIGIMNDLNA